jgi:hypothetical protein
MKEGCHHVRPFSRTRLRAPGLRPPLTLWERLPAANHHRLLWLLTQLLERQLPLPPLPPEEVRDEPAAHAPRR